MFLLRSLPWAIDVCKEISGQVADENEINAPLDLAIEIVFRHQLIQRYSNMLPKNAFLLTDHHAPRLTKLGRS